jgi:hypothetical protein
MIAYCDRYVKLIRGSTNATPNGVVDLISRPLSEYKNIAAWPSGCCVPEIQSSPVAGLYSTAGAAAAIGNAAKKNNANATGWNIRDSLCAD